MNQTTGPTIRPAVDADLADQAGLKLQGDGSPEPGAVEFRLGLAQHGFHQLRLHRDSRYPGDQTSAAVNRSPTRNSRWD